MVVYPSVRLGSNESSSGDLLAVVVPRYLVNGKAQMGEVNISELFWHIGLGTFMWNLRCGECCQGFTSKELR